jgi:hypothetical protein
MRTHNKENILRDYFPLGFYQTIISLRVQSISEDSSEWAHQGSIARNLVEVEADTCVKKNTL